MISAQCRTFATLADAVAFLADNLDNADVEAIAAQCTDSRLDTDRPASVLPPKRDYRVRAIQGLAARHAERSLRSRYLGREFPSDASHFKLGGHGQELGHIHIDFLLSDTGWQLKEIWVCR